jgi:putative copper export protein
MLAESLVDWPKPIFEFLEFLGAFLAAGAIGFRYIVIGGVRRRNPASLPADRLVHEDALRVAAWIGFAGAALEIWHVARVLPRIAANREMGVPALLGSSAPMAVWALLALFALVGFARAARRRRIGWPLAAAGVLLGTLRSGLFGDFASLVKPVHLLAGGLWIGTLFALVVAGLGVVLRHPAAPERRGAIASDLVHAFSPFALGMAAVLAFFGVILARSNLGQPSALWTTPYGKALIVKLCVVSVVVAFGAWNWRRQKPRLGTETAALSLRRSAWRELAAALVVLIITAILVSLPEPS